IPKKKKVIDVDLVEAKKQAIRKAIMVKVANKKVDELKTMFEFASYAKIHGYKPGWAFYMAKKKGIIK
ncbi:MAG: ATP-dependent helicase, partial [Lactobacillus iners]|nr:ATP-dependent helicase [Lactobacillus iners]